MSQYRWPKPVASARKVASGPIWGVVAPAAEITLPMLVPGTAMLGDAGYEVQRVGSLFGQRGYLSGTDEIRRASFMEAVKNEALSGIIAARGGYGALRLLDKLDFDAIGHAAKPIQGFSDTTALLLAITAKTGLITYHGPNLYSELKHYAPDFVHAHFKHRHHSATQQQPIVYLQKEWGYRMLVPGDASGPFIGGCLSLVRSLVGTGYLPHFSGSVIFFEDVGEEPYSIDRMLAQLFLATDIADCAGVIFGHLHKCEPENPERSLTIEEVIMDYFGGLRVPVLIDFPFGHGIPQTTLPVGGPCKIDSNGKVVLV